MTITGCLRMSDPMNRPNSSGEISPDEFARFIGADMRKQPVMVMPETHIQQILEYYMGKNTQERQEFIIGNLKVEIDLAEQETAKS